MLSPLFGGMYLIILLFKMAAYEYAQKYRDNGDKQTDGGDELVNIEPIELRLICLVIEFDNLLFCLSVVVVLLLISIRFFFFN